MAEYNGISGAGDSVGPGSPVMPHSRNLCTTKVVGRYSLLVIGRMYRLRDILTVVEPQNPLSSIGPTAPTIHLDRDHSCVILRSRNSASHQPAINSELEFEAFRDTLRR
jgi:hypothetical protein